MTRSIQAVTDATVWIDLDCGGIVGEAFGLGIDFLAPNAILAELRKPPAGHLVRLGVRSVELTAEQIAQALALRETTRSLSVQDAFACVLASSRNVMLLTGDRVLRRIAEGKGIQVHGTLWLLRQMVALRLLAPARAADALETMRKEGSRLPAEEANRLLKIWRGTKPA